MTINARLIIRSKNKKEANTFFSKFKKNLGLVEVDIKIKTFKLYRKIKHAYEIQFELRGVSSSDNIKKIIHLTRNWKDKNGIKINLSKKNKFDVTVDRNTEKIYYKKILFIWLISE